MENHLIHNFFAINETKNWRTGLQQSFVKS